MEQLEKSYKRGAEWCGYGWTREGIRAYPMRDHSEACEGRIGIVQVMKYPRIWSLISDDTCRENCQKPEPSASDTNPS